MLIRCLLLAAALWAATGSVCAVRFCPNLGLGFRTEPGVETKGLLIAGATLTVRSDAWLQADVALSAGDNPGIAQYGLGAEALLVRSAGLRLRAQVNHNQWSSWRVGENSVSGMVLASPLRRLELGIGLAWRSPQLDPARYLSPFRFAGPADELNLLYHFGWEFIRTPLSSRNNLAFSFQVADDDALHPHSAQELPFGFEARLSPVLYAAPWSDFEHGIIRYWPGARWYATARLGSSIKGLSGALFSFGGIEARIGVSYAR